MKDTLEGIAILLFVAFLIFLFVLIFVIAYRIQKKLLAGPPKPTGPFSPWRARLYFAGLTLLVLVSGIIIGQIATLLSYVVHLLFALAVVVGVIMGNVIQDGIQRAWVRSTSQLVFLSLVAAVTIYGVYQYGRYIGLQVQTSLSIYSDFDKAMETKSLQAAKVLVDYALREDTGHSGVLGYLLLKAKLGVSVDRDLHLGPALTWLYWLMEFGLILGIPIYMGRKRLRMPFCETCGSGYGKERHLGGTRAANAPFVLDLVAKKDFIGLGRLLEENAELPSLEVYVQGCDTCQDSPSHLIVRRASRGRRGLRFTDASDTVLQPRESSLLRSQLNFSGD